MVSYLDGPLSVFVDEFRRDVIPGNELKAHITILPPRPLAGSVGETLEALPGLVRNYPAFEVEAAGPRTFAATRVVYLPADSGRENLVRLNGALNQEGLYFPEVFEYTPHITLAQDPPGSSLEDVLELARRRWEGYRGPRRFVLERLTLVQYSRTGRWIDLAEAELGGKTPIPLLK